MKLIDFDKHFQKFAMNLVKKYTGKIKPEVLEEKIPDFYTAWSETVYPNLGCSPVQYFQSKSDGELVLLLSEYVLQGISIPQILLDEITTRKEIAQPLSKLLTVNNEELQTVTANLLQELQSTIGFPVYAEWILNDDYGVPLKELACELLNQDPDWVYDYVMQDLILYSDTAREFLCDILVNAKKDDRTFDLLMEFFDKDINTPLFAAYLGRYGDERALPALKRKVCSEEITYLSFLELKNAIERLGEPCDIVRDFSHDPSYQALKNLQDKK